MNSTLQPTTRDIIHAGLQQIDQSKILIQTIPTTLMPDAHTLLDALSHADDPDTALTNLIELIHQAQDDPTGQTAHIITHLNQIQSTTLIEVLGASHALGMLMRSRPQLIQAASDAHIGLATDAQSRRTQFLNAIAATSTPQGFPISTLSLSQATTRLRQTYYEQVAAIMASDVHADDPIKVQPQVSHALADTVDATLEAALAIARHEVVDSEVVRFAIIGMGKLGAQEINYVSDVDLIYVVEPVDEDVSAHQLTKIGTKLATTLQRICQSVIAGVNEPPLWQIDGALRPEGKDGPLVRRLASHQAYYEQWAQNWEFQALLKARPVAGDSELGQAYAHMASQFVWNAAGRENFVNDCQHMRERVEQLIPVALRDREMKLGRGGLRDVEFTVQMLQLVHGRTDTTLRTRSTLQALQALTDGGYVSRRDAKQLTHDYCFERVLEHRQQMWMLKRTHLFPDLGTGNEGGLEKKRSIRNDELNHNDALRRLARAVHMHPEELVNTYDETRREVRRLHNDIYYRPMLPINATDDDSVMLSEQAAYDRYAAIGFADPQAALRHVRALTDGVSRAAKINRILLPAVLRWLGEGQNPDMGLLYWSTLAERFGSQHEYLGFLRDSPNAAQRLCHVLSNSRFLGDALSKSRESITWLGNDMQLTARTRSMLDTQCEAIITRHADNMKDVANALRALRRHEIERIGLGWMSQVITEHDMLTGMTHVYDAIVQAALTWSINTQLGTLNLDTPPADISVIAMGRYGGQEINFSSDADVIIIYAPHHNSDDAQANQFARKVEEHMRTILQGTVSIEPKIELDMDLRPEGKNGPLVRSLDSCATYYGSWASTWERQALLRARYAAGNKDVAHQFLTQIANPLRYPKQPLTSDELAQIRTLKARMEAERLPRGVHRERHIKLGKGGLSDVEWTIQLLQLQHAYHIPQLQVNGTLDALHALEHHQIISHEDAATLREAWTLCTDVRNGNYLWSGRATQADILPKDVYSLGGIATYVGYEANHGQQFENQLLAVMRRAREATERLFYGRDE